MIKALILIVIIYLVIGAIVEVVTKKEGEKLTFDKAAGIRVVTWPKIIYLKIKQ